MSISSEPPTLPIEDARRVVNEWASAGFLRIKNLGDRMHLEGIVPHSSYTLRLQTQYEDRTIGQASEAYHGGLIDDQGTPPSPWDMEVRRSSDFEQRTETLPVPHTDRIQTCTGCGGAGQTTCGPCQGWGKTNCTWCQGRGFTERAADMSQTGPGQPMVRENCPHCFAGKVNCMHCQGRGRVVCSACAGAGRVKTHDVLTVRFHHQTEKAVIDATGVPDYLIHKAGGDVLTDERGVLIEQCPECTPEVEPRVNELLAKAKAVNATETIVLLQYLHVERVAIHEVTYRFPGQSATERKLWIYGSEQHVHAPGAPTNWGRILVIAGCVFVAISGLLALMLLIAK